MQIIAISGSGNGAGKSTLALKMADSIWSLAGALRDELTNKYPEYNWYNKTGEYKNTTKVKEAGGLTVREVMIQHGQQQCAADPKYYVRKLVAKLDGVRSMATGARRIAIDDIRKVVELEALREAFGPALIHYHVIGPGSVYESEFQNEELELLADYRIYWGAQ